MEVNFLDKNDFDKGDLKDELKNAGFEDCIADDIADRVDDRKPTSGPRTWDATRH
jgi:hypothetical protein